MKFSTDLNASKYNHFNFDQAVKLLHWIWFAKHFYFDHKFIIITTEVFLDEFFNADFFFVNCFVESWYTFFFVFSINVDKKILNKYCLNSISRYKWYLGLLAIPIAYFSLKLK